MKELLDKLSFDSKTLQTSGAIVLALFSMYTLFKILTNDLTHLNKAIEDQTQVQLQLNDVLRQNAEALSGNTEVLRIIERRLK